MIVYILLDKDRKYRGVFEHLQDAKAWTGRNLIWKQTDTCTWKADGFLIQEQTVY